MSNKSMCEESEIRTRPPVQEMEWPSLCRTNNACLKVCFVVLLFDVCILWAMYKQVTTGYRVTTRHIDERDAIFSWSRFLG